MEIKKAFRAVRAFSYVPKHLAAQKWSKGQRAVLPVFIVLVLLLMVGGEFWLTNLVENNISQALLEQTQTRQVAKRSQSEVTPPVSATRPPEFEVQAIIPPVRGKLQLSPGWFKHPDYDAWQYHTGLDLVVPIGAKVLAMASGVVTGLERDFDEWGLGPTGFRLRIEHPDEAVSEYIFPGEIGVKLGGEVQAGMVLGTVKTVSDEEVLVHIGLEQKGDVVDWLAILENRG